MIVDQVLSWGFSVVTWLVDLLPTLSYDCGDLSSLGSYLGWVGGYVDLGACGTALTTIVSIEGAVQAVQFVLWLYRKIPFVGAS